MEPIINCPFWFKDTALWATLTLDQRRRIIEQWVIKRKAERERLKNPRPQPTEPHTCGHFRSCEFSDGVEKWIVVLKHPHAQGETVWIERRDGDQVEVLLGPMLTVSIGENQQLPYCYRIAKQITPAQKLMAREPSVAEQSKSAAVGGV